MRHYEPPRIGYATILHKQAYLRKLIKVKEKPCIPKKLMVCLSRSIQYRQQSEGSFMPDTNLQTSEAGVMQSEANVTPSKASIILNEPGVTPCEPNVILSEPGVILNEAKNLSPLEVPTDEDTLELDLALEEELIIEDFTIDGICGVY
jgi:mycofactocin precursor